MTFYLESLGEARIGPYTVPIKDWKVDQGFRVVVHEFLDVPGAQIEKKKRHPAHITFSVVADDQFNAFYPNLVPVTIDALLRFLENQPSFDLVVPGFGPIKVTCTNWSAAYQARRQSGTDIPFEFIEDSLDVTLGIALTTSNDLGSKQQELDDAWASDTQALSESELDTLTTETVQPIRLSDGSVVPGGQSLFDAIKSSVAIIQSLQAQADIYDQQLAAELNRAIGFCATLDLTVPFQDPNNSASIQALESLWASLVATRQSLLLTGPTLLSYTTPSQMTIDDVSNAIFLDATHTDDLLALNGSTLDDPYDIPAGTVLAYFPADTAA